MKTTLIFVSLSVFVLLIFMGFTTRSITHLEPAPMSLYDSIAAMDTRWEDAYNNCKLDVMEEIISEDLEFYHDQGGLMTSKKKLNEALKANICGKVKRALKEGSL
jgi:hypothetical protein